MVELKCKMCGGNLKIIDKASYATCESCGSTMTLPNLNDDRIVNLFNRANQYRLQNEFDKAMATYENILAEDNSNAEAHWGIILAKYGIEYVKDPKTKNRVPTCHRVQYESILADLDYKEALNNAQDNNARVLYENEAKQIAEIQKNILTVARNEEPYDIFICYKEADIKGQRTKDSVFAQDIYNQLVHENYKVFFSRITLENKLGTEYEPYIFSALNSAKVMLVVGTTKENFEAIWVKNEWSRFLELVKKDKNKVIIPCYRDMVAYDLPEELSLFQAQDMNKIGFMQDLIYGIGKIVKQTSKEQNVNTNNKVIINDEADKKQMRFENNLLYARKCIDEKNWTNAEKYYKLLQEEFTKDVIIEATFFRNIAKIMYDKDASNNMDELYKSFDVIVKYYDISSENKEEILKKISEYLLNLTFPEGKLILISYDTRFYNAIVVFNDKLEQLSTIHNEAYIHSIISNHREIINAIETENERRKEFRKEFNNEQRRNNIEIEKEKYIQKIEKRLKKLKIIKIISIIWMLFVMIVETKIIIDDSTIFIACLMGFFIWGILPYLIVNWIYKITEKKIKNFT